MSIQIQGAPPSFVSFSLDDQLDRTVDDNSDLTGPCYDHDPLQQEGDYGVKLADDPYDYHTSDGAHGSRIEELDSKVKMIRQQEMIDALSTKLSQCEVENEALRVEKVILLDEVAFASQESPSPRRGWFSKHKVDENGRGGGGSLQMLLDTNAKLMTDNARLQALANIMEQSFHSYIEDSRRDSKEDKQTIRALEVENELLQQRLIAAEKIKLHLSENNPETSLTSSFPEEENQTDNNVPIPINVSQHLAQHSIAKNSLESILDQEFKFVTSGNGWTVEQEAVRATNDGLACETCPERKSMDNILDNKNITCRNPMVTLIWNANTTNTSPKDISQSKSDAMIAPQAFRRSMSEELLVDFGERSAQTSKCIDQKLWSSLAEGANCRKPVHFPQADHVKPIDFDEDADVAIFANNGDTRSSRSEDLLVEFGERRPQNPQRNVPVNLYAPHGAKPAARRWSMSMFR